MPIQTTHCELLRLLFFKAAWSLRISNVKVAPSIKKRKFHLPSAIYYWQHTFLEFCLKNNIYPSHRIPLLINKRLTSLTVPSGKRRVEKKHLLSDRSGCRHRDVITGQQEGEKEASTWTAWDRIWQNGKPGILLVERKCASRVVKGGRHETSQVRKVKGHLGVAKSTRS